jgi:hypothetical protein
MDAGASAMTFYKAKGAEIVDETGKQIAIVLASNCSKKAARMMAAFCAQQMNHEEANKERKNKWVSVHADHFKDSMP